MNELTEDFEKSLFNDTKEILGDYLELGIDIFINDDILKEIPIVKTIVSVLKAGKNIHDRNLLMQTLIFIDEFNKNKVSEEQLNKYKKQIENDNKKCEEELGRVLLLLNNFIDKEKSIMISKLFKAYVKQIINWNEFCEYSEIVNRLFIQDIEALKKVYIDDIIIIDDFDNSYRYRLDRIASIGLINLYSKSKFSFGDEILDDFTIAKTEIGDKFVKIIIN